MSFLNLRVGACLLAFNIWQKAEWSTYTVNSVLLSKCLKPEMLLAKPVNLCSLVLYLDTASGNLFE